MNANNIPCAIRVLLQTETQQDYQRIIGQPIGEFSLQEEIAQHHSTLSLLQQIPKTPQYPSMRVVDLIPATVCSLKQDAIVVVLPPGDVSFNNTIDSFMTPDANDDILYASDNRNACVASCAESYEPMVRVQLNKKRSCSRCLGNSSLFQALFLPDNALLEIAFESYRTVFALEGDPGNADGALDSSIGGLDVPLLQLSKDVFQNVRRVAVSRCLAAPQISFSFRDSSFYIPLDWFNTVESEDGEALLPTEVVMAQRVSICPAVDDFILRTLYGDQYDALFSLAVEAAAGVLENHFVCAGDVYHVPLSFPDGRHIQQSGPIDAVEVVSNAIHHKVQQWSSVFTREGDVANFNLMPLRIAGIITLKEGSVDNKCFAQISIKANGTQISMVSQTFVPPLPYLSPFYPPEKGFYCELDYKTKIRDCLDTCFHAQGGWGVHVFVSQGLPENIPCELIEDTGKEYGVFSVVASLDGLNDQEVSILLQKFSQQRAPMILIIKGAQKICADSPQLLNLLDFPRLTTRNAPKALFLVCESIDAVSPLLSSRAQHSEGVVLCGNPSEEDRKTLVGWSLESMCRVHGIHKSLALSYDAVGAWTTGLPISDILSFTSECVATSVPKVPYIGDVYPVLSDIQCEATLQRYLHAHGHSLVSTKLQPVRWSDVGGLEEAKKELRDTIQLPILHPELFANGLKKRAGILFYGPPGCGKTLLAKAVATEMNMNFMSVKGPELINQYVGESERNIRILFQKARDNSPCIIFFDELDALAPARGAKGDAGGAMDRIVSQLLVEVDGVGQKRSDGTDGGDVFIIGATNRPDLLDPSLLRPGRFDRLCYLGIPSSKEEQLYAVKALTRKFKMDADVSLPQLVEPLELVYTGADFFALCSDAMMNAVDESLEKLKNDIAAGLKSMAQDAAEDDTEEEAEAIKVSMRHFLAARNNLKASVTPEDLARYESLKTKFSAK